MTAATIPSNWHVAPHAELRAGPVLVFDLDGVLADALHRQHFLHLPEPDWDGFYGAVDADRVLEQGRALASRFRDELPVVVLTGRIDAVSEATRTWLDRNGLRWDLLICRPPADDDDSTHAVDYKRVEVQRLLDLGIEPVLAVDDNRKIVAMYEEFGIPSLYFPSGYYDNSARYDGGV